MILGEVMQEIADRLEAISGLRVFAYPPGTVSPPAGWVGYPDTFEYDETYGRGFDRLSNLPVAVVVGRPTDRATRDAIGAYVDGSGAKSVKAVLEAGTYTAFDAVRVTGGEFGVVNLGGTDYLAATFDLDITGPGST